MLEVVVSRDECSNKSFRVLYREDEGKYSPFNRQYPFTN